jgi:hypothetical protein
VRNGEPESSVDVDVWTLSTARASNEARPAKGAWTNLDVPGVWRSHTVEMYLLYKSSARP